MFDYEYARELIGGLYNIDSGTLDKKIVEGGLPSHGVKCDLALCTVSFLEELTVEQKIALDSVVVLEKADISLRKILKIELIKQKTQENEALGVPYNNYRFSITPAAKSNWLAVVISKDSLSYPFDAPTGFGAIYQFQSANDVLGFFGASMSYLKYWEESDEQLAIAINACTTIEQLNAIVDDRSYPPS